MKKLVNIANEVFKEIKEDSTMIYFNADLNGIPPFMCSPFNEGWFWSDKIKNLVNYIFEVIIANYLINDAMILGDFDNENDEVFDFLQSIEIYKKHKNLDSFKTAFVEELVSLYHQNTNKDLSYLELVKLLIDIEKCAPAMGIELYFESYSSPLEARHSKNISNDKFDIENLKDNFNID